MRWQVVQVSHTGRVRRVLAKDAPTHAIACEWRDGYDLRRLEVRVQWPQLTERQVEAVKAGVLDRWLGTRETGTMGHTMMALEAKGLATVKWARRPHRRLVYRLTTDGDLMRSRLRGTVAQTTWDELLAARWASPPSAGVRCRCVHCGAVFEDATPGGSCGRCGLEVLPV